jgi:hypothetical protein
MDIKLTEEAVKDKEEISEQEWREIKPKLREISEKLSHKDLKLISNPLLKHSIWQLTIDDEETNHRAYLDVRNGRTIVIAIWSFEFTHQGDQHWEELEERI